MILLHLALSFVAGATLAVLERLLVLRLGAAPDLAAVALALLLSARLRRSTGPWAIGLLLGFSTRSFDALGSWLLGGGIAAAVLLPMRELVFVESPSTQAIFGLLCAGAFLAARVLYSLFSSVALLPFGARELVAPLLAGATVPILRGLFDAAVRGWRRLRERWQERGRDDQAPAAG